MRGHEVLERQAFVFERGEQALARGEHGLGRRAAQRHAATRPQPKRDRHQALPFEEEGHAAQLLEGEPVISAVCVSFSWKKAICCIFL